MKEDIVKICSAIAVLFLGGLFVHVVWNAVAYAWNLPEFGYWVCVCFIGAFGIICRSIGSIFHCFIRNDE